jgi:cysteine rich repeat protein
MTVRLWPCTLLAAAMTVASTVGAEPLQKIPYVLRPGPPQETPDGEIRAACAKDFRALCANVQPGNGRVRDCIATHIDVLAPDCRAAINRRGLAAAAGKQGEPVRSAQWSCVQDAKLFCANVPPGPGRVVKCLEEHLVQLKPACQSSLQSAKGRPRSS